MENKTKEAERLCWDLIISLYIAGAAQCVQSSVDV